MYFVKLFTRGSSHSGQEYSLLLEKSSRVNKMLTPPLNLVPKTMFVIAFIIALTLEVKFVWCDCQVAVCVKKRHKNAIIGCGYFQKFSFYCLLLKLLVGSPKKLNHITLCMFLTQFSILISGT